MVLDTKNNSLLLSRRRILWSGAVGATIAAAAWAGSSQAAAKKMSQAAVSYQPRPKNGTYCVKCALFTAPDKCQVVEGSVAPSGWCTLYAPK